MRAFLKFAGTVCTAPAESAFLVIAFPIAVQFTVWFTVADAALNFVLPA